MTNNKPIAKKKKLRRVVTGIVPQLGDLISLLDEFTKYIKAYNQADKTQQAISAAKIRIRGKSLLATTGTLAVFATPAIVLHKLLENQIDSLHRIRSGLENVDKFAANKDMPGLDAQHVIIYAAILLAVTTLFFSWLARSFAGKKAMVAELAESPNINEVKARDYFVKFGIFAEPPLPEKRKSTLIESSFKGTDPVPGEGDRLIDPFFPGNRRKKRHTEKEDNQSHSFVEDPLTIT